MQKIPARALVGFVSVLLAAGFIAGCGDPEPVRVLKPDFSVEAHWGDPGNYGVAMATTRMTILIDRKADVDVYLPMNTEADLADGPFVPVVLAQGSPVSTDRYAWLAKHVASWGHVVLVPHHPFNVATMDSARVLEVLKTARRLSDSDHPWMAGKIANVAGVALGHSRGGTVAASAWHDDPGEFSTLVMLAAVPGFDASTRDTSHEDLKGRVVTLWGSEDGYIEQDDFVSSLSAYGSSPTAAIVEGMNHMQLTDDVTDGEKNADGEAGISEEEARARAFFLIDGALASARGEDASALDDVGEWPAGLTEVSQ
jgi:predicted dienelactone hydrolase